MTTETVTKAPETEIVDSSEVAKNGVSYRPNVDIVETADELTVFADLPGVEPNDLDIHFKNGTLTIHGRVEKQQREHANYLVREYGVGDYFRAFPLSEVIDAARITAEFNGGVLTLHLPKVEAVKPRKIDVKVG